MNKTVRKQIDIDLNVKKLLEIKAAKAGMKLKGFIECKLIKLSKE